MNPQRLAACLVACLYSLITASASGGDSVWQRATAPTASIQEQLFAETESLYDMARRAQRSGSQDGPRLLTVLRRRLIKGGARKAHHALLNELLARVEYKLYERTRDTTVLRLAAAGFARAAARSNSVMKRASALNELAVCRARLGETTAELAAYNGAIRYEPHAETRAILLANRAEGHMARGNIRSAIRGYRVSLRDTPFNSRHRLAVTTHWGLAVALDRDGDLDAALEQIRLARNYDPEDKQLHGPHWFFMPAYDTHWYTALGHWAHARASKTTDVKRRHYERALHAWDTYRAQAARNDRWLDTAAERRARCQREMDQGH